jgi:carbamoyl-phosphate synthase large subunit
MVRTRRPHSAKRVLILRAGSALTNNVIRSLRADPSLFIVGCHDDRFTLSKSTADRNYVNPAADQVLVSALNAIIRRERIDLLIPTNDTDALKIARLSDALECRTFLPTPELIERCQDKYRCAVLLKREGVPVAATYRIVDSRHVDVLFRRLKPHRKLWCRIRAGTGSFGAIPVTRPSQVRSWIRYWEEMRGIRPGSFTLSEYLPGRDFGVQSLWKRGRLILTKMAERLKYMDSGSPSGVSSMPALARMAWEPEVFAVCERAVRALDPKATGVFFIDVKENSAGKPCITEINAGRFAAMTNIYDLAGRHNMALTYVRLSLDQPVRMRNARDFAEDVYFVRSVDTLPTVISAKAVYDFADELDY